VYLYSTIKMMHSPINLRSEVVFDYILPIFVNLSTQRGCLTWKSCCVFLPYFESFC